MSRLSQLALSLTASTLILAGAADAHPRLSSSNPASGAVVGHVSSLQLQFSETLVPAFSGGQVIMTGMPGVVRHRPTLMAARSSLGTDRHSIVLTTARPLPTGTYRLDWHAVSTDTHRVAGALVFTVR